MGAYNPISNPIITPGMTPNKNPAAILYKETETCLNNSPLAIKSKNVPNIAVGGGKNRISRIPVCEHISQIMRINNGEIIVSSCLKRSFTCCFFHSCCSVS